MIVGVLLCMFREILSKYGPLFCERIVLPSECHSWDSFTGTKLALSRRSTSVSSLQSSVLKTDCGQQDPYTWNAQTFPHTMSHACFTSTHYISPRRIIVRVKRVRHFTVSIINLSYCTMKTVLLMNMANNSCFLYFVER